MRRPDLVSDCARCSGLCCVATSFEASPAFAIDKPAGVACPHLCGDFRCAIHDELALRGFRGCAAYDCYGAGPRATRAFAGDDPRVREAAFLCLRVIHELVWQLGEATALCPPALEGLRAELAAEVAALDALAAAPARALLDVDLDPYRRRVRELLRRVGARAVSAPPSSC